MTHPLEAAAMAGDHEDAAQKGEPSLWDENYFPRGEEGMDILCRERLAVYRAAIIAFLEATGVDAIVREQTRDGSTTWIDSTSAALSSLMRIAEEAP